MRPSIPLAYCVRARPVPPGHGGSLWSPHNFASRSERRPTSRTFAGPNESNQSKGPHIWPMRSGKKVRPATRGLALRTARPTRRANALALRHERSVRSVGAAARRPNLLAGASRSDRVQALCFGDFHLGQQMFAKRGDAHFAKRSYAETKVTGGAGPGPGAVPRAAENIS